MKISFKEILRRSQINGVELPFIGGGISWKTNPSEKEIANKFLLFLADRRALYQKWELEHEIAVMHSMREIRQRITIDIQNIDSKSNFFQAMRELQITCQSFLTLVENHTGPLGLHPPSREGYPRPAPFDHTWRQEQIEFYVELGKLRSIFGHIIAAISIQFKIDIDERLEPILPNYSLKYE